MLGLSIQYWLSTTSSSVKDCSALSNGLYGKIDGRNMNKCHSVYLAGIRGRANEESRAESWLPEHPKPHGACRSAGTAPKRPIGQPRNKIKAVNKQCDRMTWHQKYAQITAEEASSKLPYLIFKTSHLGFSKISLLWAYQLSRVMQPAYVKKDKQQICLHSQETSMRKRTSCIHWLEWVEWCSSSMATDSEHWVFSKHVWLKSS